MTRYGRKNEMTHLRVLPWKPRRVLYVRMVTQSSDQISFNCMLHFIPYIYAARTCKMRLVGLVQEISMEGE